MDENLKITDKYKTEISSILSNVSEGLAENVRAAISPKIKDISDHVVSLKEVAETKNLEIKHSILELEKVSKSIESSIQKYSLINDELKNLMEQGHKSIEAQISKNQILLAELEININEKIHNEIVKLSNQNKKDSNKKIHYFLFVTIALLLIIVVMLVFLIKK